MIILIGCVRMVNKKEFCKNCPFHKNVELVHTVSSNGECDDYCPKCQEMFGEKI